MPESRDGGTIYSLQTEVSKSIEKQKPSWKNALSRLVAGDNARKRFRNAAAILGERKTPQPDMPLVQPSSLATEPHEQIYRGTEESLNPTSPSAENSDISFFLKDRQLRDILQKNGWNGGDLYNFRKFAEAYKKEGYLIPFTKEWFLSQPESAVIWGKAVTIVREVSLLIGDIDGFNPDDEEHRMSLENEIDKLTDELKKLGIQGTLNPNSENSTLLSAGRTPLFAVRSFVNDLIANIPNPTGIQVNHATDVAPESGEWNLVPSTPVNENQLDEPTGENHLSLMEPDRISSKNREWHQIAGMIHITTMFLDCQQELLNGV
jgi:hypothetical protein